VAAIGDRQYSLYTVSCSFNEPAVFSVIACHKNNNFITHLQEKIQTFMYVSIALDNNVDPSHRAQLLMFRI
jgi:hypothetical protein